MKIRTTSITQKIILSATPEEVYEALLNPKNHSEFTGNKATGKSVIGAKFTAWDGYIIGKNLKLQKGKHIVQQWSTTDWPKGYPPSKLEIILKKVEDKTELIMIHSNVPVEQEEELKQGWIDFYWEPLKSYFK
jgi:activator of HSP90 ATPase